LFDIVYLRLKRVPTFTKGLVFAFVMQRFSLCKSAIVAFHINFSKDL
jgi:hypothetical protein